MESKNRIKDQLNMVIARLAEILLGGKSDIHMEWQLNSCTFPFKYLS